jgi:hypothetical protein
MAPYKNQSCRGPAANGLGPRQKRVGSDRLTSLELPNWCIKCYIPNDALIDYSWKRKLYAISEVNGVDRLKPGDRVWVRNPRVIAERKVGTIISTRKTSTGIRYIVEWEVDLEEPPNHHPGYLEKEISPVKGRGVRQRSEN